METFVLEAPGDPQLAHALRPDINQTETDTALPVQQAAWRVQESQSSVIKFLEGHMQPVTCLAALSHTFASGSGDRVCLYKF